MTVYVDDARIPARVGKFNARWSHLIADTKEELHEFAERLGLKRSYFQDPVVSGKPKAQLGTRHAENWHYDVTESKRQMALELGAVAVTFRELPGIIDARWARRQEQLAWAARELPSAFLTVLESHIRELERTDRPPKALLVSGSEATRLELPDDEIATVFGLPIRRDDTIPPGYAYLRLPDDNLYTFVLPNLVRWQKPVGGVDKGRVTGVWHE
jgi:hypothetical protein